MTAIIVIYFSCSHSKVIKELNDREIIDAGIRAMVEFGQVDLMPHFIYCGWHYFEPDRVPKFRKMFLDDMKTYGFQSSLLTMMFMWRRNLITKEKAKEASKGNLINDEEWKNQEMSINDDLTNFVTGLQKSKEMKHEKVGTFFTPKLTDEELKLFKLGNEDHLNTYMFHYVGSNADVNITEMKKSNSKSKYVHGSSVRETFTLTLERTET